MLCIFSYKVWFRDCSMPSSTNSISPSFPGKRLTASRLAHARTPPECITGLPQIDLRQPFSPAAIGGSGMIELELRGLHPFALLGSGVEFWSWDRTISVEAPKFPLHRLGRLR